MVSKLSRQLSFLEADLTASPAAFLKERNSLPHPSTKLRFINQTEVLNCSNEKQQFVSMHSDQPQSSQPQKHVLYHCACGAQIILDQDIGGICGNCSKTVAPELLPKLIEHDLGVTVALENDDFQIDDTFSLRGISQTVDLSPLAFRGNLAGQMFGHFKLISPLGKGGMGQVYRALDTSLQRFVAVKLLKSGIENGRVEPVDEKTTTLAVPNDAPQPNQENNEDSPESGNAASGSSSKGPVREIDKLLQEAVSQARVTHPNIVTIYYVGKQNGDPFLAMELVNGPTLSQSIAERELGFDEIVSVALDITEALQFSYQLDIIHGDIKPSNLLITKNGTAKLSDFGMARRASHNEEQTVGGTPNYIAPEILHGEKPSIQTDIYALGVTLFEMTFGKLPRTLTGRSIQRWIEIHDSAEIDFPANWPARLPDHWKSILAKMLAKDPTERYQNYRELLTDLKRVESGSKVPARLLPRIFAAATDWVTVVSLAIVVQFVLTSPNWGNVGASHPVFVTLLRIADFLPFIAYMILIYFWRQSIGRNLMHLRVVNQHGMRASGKLMALRSAFRMQFPLVVICRMLFVRVDGWTEVTLAVLVVFSMLLLLLDFASMLVNSSSRSVHDLLTNTHVVLDTQQ